MVEVIWPQLGPTEEKKTWPFRTDSQSWYLRYYLATVRLDGVVEKAGIGNLQCLFFQLKILITNTRQQTVTEKQMYSIKIKIQTVKVKFFGSITDHDAHVNSLVCTLWEWFHFGDFLFSFFQCVLHNLILLQSTVLKQFGIIIIMHTTL